MDEKSNEIVAIPELLEMLEIAGCIITIDAIGRQTEIAETIVQQDGDYVFALKGNQDTNSLKICTAVYGPGRERYPPIGMTPIPTLTRP